VLPSSGIFSNVNWKYFLKKEARIIVETFCIVKNSLKKESKIIVESLSTKSS
jgi:hypothetical protein